VGCYLVGWIAESVRYWSVSGERYRWAGILLGVGWGAHTLLFIVLALQQGIDVSLMLNGAAWAALLLYYGAMHRWANRVFPLVFPPFAVAMLITAYFASRTGVPPASE
ncbi:MAG: hypothetical protein GWO03_07260, partial [Gammaproteobacteria bacterium]|nr:hypothetical protein [Gammaproteobacteria bacterium]